MEKIVKSIITKHLNKENLIINEQHGFVSNKSCVTNLLETLDLITHALENGYNIDIGFYDFAKAFDSVPHERLKLKLSAYGINGKILNWISAFLSDRVQRVILGGSASEWTRVLSGVPQGSVLGPLLFVIYINDLLRSLINKGKLFADDTKCINVIKSEQDCINMQTDINKLVEWTDKWLIKFNSEKCKVMHIGKTNPKWTYTITHGSEVQELQETKLEKDLGILLSNDLKWCHQVDSAKNKANKVIGRIKHAFTYLDSHSIKKLYTSLVRPHLEYANTIWNPTLKKDIEALEKVQRRATKMFCMRNKPYGKRLETLNLTSLEDRRNRGDLIQMFKIVNGKDKVNWVRDLRKICSNTRGHKSRYERELTKKSSQRFNFFINRVVNNWNSLDQQTIDSESVNAFKNNLDRKTRVGIK